MAEIILSNCICIAISLIVLIGLFLENDKENLSAKRCKYMAYAALAFAVINLATEILDGNSEIEGLVFTVNLLSYYAVDILTITFVAYIGVFLGDAKEKKYLNAVVITIIIRIIMVTVLAFKGTLFRVENGYFVEGTQDIYVYLLSVLATVGILTIIIVRRKDFTTREFVVIMIYEILPIVATIVESVAEIYTPTVAITALSVLMVYIFIQHETLEHNRVRADLFEEISSTDLLTGLGNRRAYYKHIDALDGEKNVGIVFCDINGLKYVNDHFGHPAGDEHLKKFAQIMNKCFRGNEVFRLSGDEFIAVMAGIPEDRFEQRIANFRTVIDKNDKIAAFGCAFGNACCVEKLYAEAEEAMYVDKRDNSMSRNTLYNRE